ncbi:MAG: hypothetical protein ACT4PX_12105 [Actinomycetota bacterium]
MTTLAFVLAGTGVSMMAAAAGMVVGRRVELRRLVRAMTAEAQAWLDERASA